MIAFSDTVQYMYVCGRGYTQGLDDSFLRPCTVHVCMCEGVVTYRALMMLSQTLYSTCMYV